MFKSITFATISLLASATACSTPDDALCFGQSLRARSKRMNRSAARRITELCLALVLTGCVAEGDRPVPVVVPEPAYEELYPHYVELCAVSQFRSKGGDLGGVPGHAVMYLKGACRKADAPYPKLEMCAAPSDDPESLDHGVGVSVNKMFKNINWMATPGRDLFFDGRLDPGETLTQDYYDATLEEAIQRGLFDGIEIHDSYLQNPAPERTVAEVVARGAIGTDFALRYARCIRRADLCAGARSQCRCSASHRGGAPQARAQRIQRGTRWRRPPTIRR